MKGEINTLRSRLTQFESEATGRVATVTAMQAEIAALQEALEATRQVGKTAMAALQICGEALPQPAPQPHRWRQLLFGVFGAAKGYRSR